VPAGIRRIRCGEYDRAMAERLGGGEPAGTRAPQERGIAGSENDLLPTMSDADAAAAGDGERKVVVPVAHELLVAKAVAGALRECGRPQGAGDRLDLRPEVFGRHGIEVELQQAPADDVAPHLDRTDRLAGRTRHGEAASRSTHGGPRRPSGEGSRALLRKTYPPPPGFAINAHAIVLFMRMKPRSTHRFSRGSDIRGLEKTRC
jgi:hypothetical protein